MLELKQGTIVHLTNGGTAKVIKKLGQGGQGAVYVVEVNGKQMALKWYINKSIINDNNFYENIANNIRIGKPSDAFLWPEFLTLKEYESYGYIMPLRPKQYIEFGQYLLAKSQFKSFRAIFNAAENICEGFKNMHIKGLSYQDLNDGNFFIEPTTGDVLICDNDNVIANGSNLGIAGKTRYMAPEVVAGNAPTTYSDRFSLTVILFLLFFFNHPFEGAKVLAQPCMRESDEKKFFGSEMIFIYNPTNKSNLPVRGVHKNVLKRWCIFPKLLKQQFIEEFSTEKLYNNPQSRLIEAEWVRLLKSVEDLIIICPICNNETFLEDTCENSRCLNCGKDIVVEGKLLIGKRKLPLVATNKYFLAGKDSLDFETFKSSTDQLLWLRNKSKQQWSVITTSGKARVLNPEECVPAKDGIKIKFSGTLEGEIKV